jgi:hypothetical protein
VSRNSSSLVLRFRWKRRSRLDFTPGDTISWGNIWQNRLHPPVIHFSIPPAHIYHDNSNDAHLHPSSSSTRVSGRFHCQPREYQLRRSIRNQEQPNRHSSRRIKVNRPRLAFTRRSVLTTGRFSFEFFAFPDYVNTVPSTTTCLANLQSYAGSAPPVRIGGTTQYVSTF